MHQEGENVHTHLNCLVDVYPTMPATVVQSRVEFCKPAPAPMVDKMCVLRDVQEAAVSRPRFYRAVTGKLIAPIKLYPRCRIQHSSLNVRVYTHTT